MGIVFGSTGSAEPKYQSLQMEPFEIRMYPSYLVAEVVMQQSGNDDAKDDSFRVLAQYIGVFGTPANDGGKGMAMTAPVIQSSSAAGGGGERMAMTAPVLQSEQKMAFVLPFEYTDLADAPRPTNSRVTLRKVPERVVACRCFSGWYSKDLGRQQFKELQVQLLAENLISKPSSSSDTEAVDEDRQWVAAQYHPPFTIPFLRRNEIWVELSESLPPVKSLLQKLRAATK